MDDRKLTLIVVPHGDLETRTYEIPYGRLKLMLGGAGLIVLLFIVIASSWWMVAAQAARVPGLEREVARLEGEQRKVVELARTLAEVEQQYERVRKLLGADGAGGEAAPLLPPLGDSPAVREGAATGAADVEPSVGAERRRRRNAAAGAEDDVASTALPASWPLAQAGFITQELGPGDGRHPGIDIAVPADSYIRAAAAGVVRDAGEDRIYGRYVLLAHEDGYESMYGHASSLFVAAGDTVERHQIIALTGSTGRSTAPHLHFEVRRDGRALDPLTLVRKP